LSLYLKHMKFLPAFSLILVITIAISCKNRSAQPVVTPPAGDSTATADSASTYLPIADFIRADLKYVDSFAGGILRKITINGKQDSGFIKPAQLHQAAQAFLLPELEPDNFRQSFKESSLMDETTGLVQFMYTPTSPSSSLRTVIAYVNPSASGNNVNRIYLEREWAAGDTLVQQKLTWKVKQYFYTITTRQPPQGTPVTTIEKLIWEPEQFHQ